MTTPKAALRLPARTPAYVSRDVGAAELGISPETWNRWVESGRLPPAAPGFPPSAPRWRWADVDARLQGETEARAAATVPDVAKAAEFYGNAAKKGRKRELAA